MERKAAAGVSSRLSQDNYVKRLWIDGFCVRQHDSAIGRLLSVFRGSISGKQAAHSSGTLHASLHKRARLV